MTDDQCRVGKEDWKFGIYKNMKEIRGVLRKHCVEGIFQRTGGIEIATNKEDTKINPLSSLAHQTQDWNVSFAIHEF